MHSPQGFHCACSTFRFEIPRSATASQILIEKNASRSSAEFCYIISKPPYILIRVVFEFVMATVEDMHHLEKQNTDHDQGEVSAEKTQQERAWSICQVHGKDLMPL